MIADVAYSKDGFITAEIDGMFYSGIDVAVDGEMPRRVKEWIDAGNDPAPYVAPPAPIPTITRVQALLWLLTIGKTDADVLAAIATIPDDYDRAVAQIEWDEREPFHRSHPLFDQLGPALGLSSDELDSAFVAAAVL